MVTENYTFRNDIELQDFLLNSITKDKKVAIVGGHYLLFYDQDSDSLKPLISKDLTKRSQIEFAEMFTGFFPEKSIYSSIKLLNRLKQKEIFSKQVFIVNDHKFQGKNFQTDINGYIKGRTGVLRKKYYANNQIPSYFLEEFKKNKISIANDIQYYNIDDMQKQDNLLKSGYFFSEQRLRNKFEKNLKEKLFVKGEIVKVEDSGAVEIFYSGFKNQNICLTENGGCGCSGEVMEFIYELSELGYSDIVFFVPDECVEAANNGFSVIANILNKPLCIYSVFGIGGFGVSKTNGIYLKYISNEQ